MDKTLKTILPIFRKIMHESTSIAWRFGIILFYVSNYVEYVMETIFEIEL